MILKPFLLGGIMISGRKLVHGVGLNDCGYRVFDTTSVNGRQVNSWTCPFYRVWVHMLQRCYSPLAKHSRGGSSYADCFVCDEWHSFKSFRAWMIAQPWEGNEIDKDLLVRGNKEYRPDRCIFISQELNKFMTSCASARGRWPVGVSRIKATGVFRSSCRNPFIDKYEHLGCFPDDKSAHEAWRKRKHQLACRYADAQSDVRIAEALRIKYSAYMEKY